MGYSYGRNARGNLVLACDNCGDLGGVRKRRCPYDYCPPPALCGPCNARLSGELHGDRCRDGAAVMLARYEADKAALDAGDMLVQAAWGDWADGVPAGMVRVLFCGRGTETYRLVPAGEYHPGAKPRLSDYDAVAVPA